MKRFIVWTSLLIVALGWNAAAIDRQAAMIDRIQFDFGYLNDADFVGGSIWSENAFLPSDGQWAFLFGGGMGSISPTVGDDDDYWMLGVGLKYYPAPDLSVALIGHYNWLGNGSSRKIAGAMLEGKYRLLPADQPVSPYVIGGVGGRTRSTFSNPEVSDDSVSAFVYNIGLGVEFQVNETFSMDFTGSFVGSDESDDATEDLDGWVGSIAMRYYWF